MSEPVDYGKDLLLDEEDLNDFEDLPELQKNFKDLFDLLNGANKKLNNLLTDLLKEEAISYIKYDLEEEKKAVAKAVAEAKGIEEKEKEEKEEEEEEEEEKNKRIKFMLDFFHHYTYYTNGIVAELNNIYNDALKLANEVQTELEKNEVQTEKTNSIYQPYNNIIITLNNTIKLVEEERKKPNKQIDEDDFKIYDLKHKIVDYNRSIAQEKEEKAEAIAKAERIEEKAKKEKDYTYKLYTLQALLDKNKRYLKTITDIRATSGYREDILKKQMDKYIVVFLSEKLKNVNLDKLSIDLTGKDDKEIYRVIYVNLKFITDNIYSIFKGIKEIQDNTFEYSIFKGIKEIQDNSYQEGGFRKKNNLKPTVVQSKEVLGKIRRIYKVAGSRKEHIKYKGELISVSDYKKLVSQAKALKSQNKPVAKPKAEPATKSAAKPATKSAAKPAAKSTTKSATKSAAKPAAKPKAKPTAKSATKPKAKPKAK